LQQGKAETILVVEDDTAVRQLAVNMLRSLGILPWKQAAPDPL